MANGFVVDDKVFVPASKIPGLEGHPSAFYETKVVEVDTRKLKVAVPDVIFTIFDHFYGLRWS